MRHWILACLAVLAIGVAYAAPAGAQEASSISDGLKSMVEQAQKDGMTVVVISPDAKSGEAAPPPGESMTGMGLRLREEIRRLAVTAPAMPGRIATAFEIISPDGSAKWLVVAVLTALAGILLGYFPRRLIGIWGREHFRYMYSPHPHDDAERIGYLLFRASLQAVYTVLLFGVAMLVAIAFDTGHEPSRSTIFVIVAAYCVWRISREVIGFNLLAPDVPSHRMLSLSDADAKAIFRDFNWVFAVAITVLGTSAWITSLDLDGDANKLLLIVASFIAAGLIGYLTLKHRKAVAGVILGAGPAEAKPVWLRIIAGGWHILALLYLVAATVFSIVRLLLGLPSANLLISAPAIALIGGLSAYGVMLLIIERFYRSRRAAFDRRLRVALHAERDRRAREKAARIEIEQSGLVEDEEVETNLEPDGRHAALRMFKPLFRPLLQQSAALIVSIIAFDFVLSVWDVNVGQRGNLGTAFVDTLVVAFIAWFLYRVVAAYADDKLAAEGVSPHGGDPEDEPGGHGATRLGTLLPLLRNVAIATIVAIAGMIVLANLGVDIGPLFAGAGVVGLAVGFGAQTLIRDIFSGGFFLFDDAFRKGEYVELGNIRGTVEKISLRSFQLRHHNGPLHTIPFGEITQLTNYSRDWVIMKLPLRVTYDTDVEKVRKLVKKVGEQLLEHPDVGKSFLQPLKSQGVVQMEDSAMIIRVKFMTKPGDQWMTRKVVYAAIQELFRREGIRFANREVTVRLAEEPRRPLSVQQKEAVAGAAHRIIHDEADEVEADGDDR